MCRHLGFVGAPVPLADLVFAPPRSLVEQSYAPTDMRGAGTINADGFGIGWFPDGDRPPVRVRRATPIWSDTGLASLAGTISSTAVLAAVRSATVGMPVVETACAPFGDGGWLFSHNGVVRGWPDSVATLAARLPTIDLLTLDAPCDSALLWALVRAGLRSGASPETALCRVVGEVERAAPGSRLNLLLVGRHQVVATAVGHSLTVRRTDLGVVVSSEPLDDKPDWVSVPDRSLVVADSSGSTIEPLEDVVT